MSTNITFEYGTILISYLNSYKCFLNYESSSKQTIQGIYMITYVQQCESYEHQGL